MPTKRDNAEERLERLEMLIEQNRAKHDELESHVKDLKKRMADATLEANTQVERARSLTARRKRR